MGGHRGQSDTLAAGAGAVFYKFTLTRDISVKFYAGEQDHADATMELWSDTDAVNSMVAKTDGQTTLCQRASRCGDSYVDQIWWEDLEGKSEGKTYVVKISQPDTAARNTFRLSWQTTLLADLPDGQFDNGGVWTASRIRVGAIGEEPGVTGFNSLQHDPNDRSCGSWCLSWVENPNDPNQRGQFERRDTDWWMLNREPGTDPYPDGTKFRFTLTTNKVNGAYFIVWNCATESGGGVGHHPNSKTATAVFYSHSFTYMAQMRHRGDGVYDPTAPLTPLAIPYEGLDGDTCIEVKSSSGQTNNSLQYTLTVEAEAGRAADPAPDPRLPSRITIEGVG